MRKFLIETVNNEIVDDWSFALIQSIKYINWYSGEKIYYALNNDIYFGDESYIPVGCWEFVHNWMKEYYNIDNIKPINIPKELEKPEYLGRNIRYLHSSEIKINDFITKYFIKSINKIKGFSDVITKHSKFPEDDYLVSDYIKIQSEWRCFVDDGYLRGLQRYSGDFYSHPDVDLIKQMIDNYKDSPYSYTIDVAVSDNKTVLIEVHNFYSCGLYGFYDELLLPDMFDKGIKYLKENYVNRA